MYLPVVAVSKVQREAGGSDCLEPLLCDGVGSRVQVQTHQVLQLLHMQAAHFTGSFLHTFPTLFKLIANVTIDMWLRTWSRRADPPLYPTPMGRLLRWSHSLCGQAWEKVSPPTAK